MVRRNEVSISLAPDRNPPEIRFIADAMLGRLARWLRFLGYDTCYQAGISDSQLLRIAREENRCILTRDTRLIKRKAVGRYLLISENNSYSQLLEVIHGLKLATCCLFSRCVKCNGYLTGITDKSEIKDSVPEFVYLNTDVFLRCHDCGRVYWEGSHPKHFQAQMRNIIRPTS